MPFVDFGLDASSLKARQAHPIRWSTEGTVNPHVFFAGMSGSGKSYELRAFVRRLLESAGNAAPRIHVFDVHGDLDMPGSSTVNFTEQSEYGLNPLVVQADPDFGGVRKRIQSLMSILNKTSRSLGPKQEAVLRHLLVDLYAANGFFVDSPRSWPLDDGVQRRYPKKYPTFEDAFKFAYAKLKAMYLGGASNAVVAALEATEKAGTALRKRARQKIATEEDAQKLQTAKENAVECFEEYVAAIETGYELDEAMKYDSRDVLKSVVDRLENLRATGLLKGRAPPFDRAAPVWRRKINALSMDERKLFTLLDLEEIFFRAVQRGPTDQLLDVIVLDEAHIFMDDDPDNITAKIVREARKFGVAMVCASQNPTDIPEEMFASIGCKVLLALDELYWDSVSRKLGIEREALKWVRAHRSALIQVKRKGENSNAYAYTVLGAHETFRPQTQAMAHV